MSSASKLVSKPPEPHHPPGLSGKRQQETLQGNHDEEKGDTILDEHPVSGWETQASDFPEPQHEKGAIFGGLGKGKPQGHHKEADWLKGREEKQRKPQGKPRFNHKEGTRQ